MKKEKKVPLGKVVAMYEGRLSPQFIKVTYRYLQERIDFLSGPIGANGNHLIEEGSDRNERVLAMEKIAQEETATKKTLKSCEEAWDRLITGQYGICSACGEKINPDRLKAIPNASRCTPCETRNGKRTVL